MKSIIFVMPCMAFSPVGGFKVVNEYARRFSKDGYSVSIIYPLWRNYGKWSDRMLSVIKDSLLLLCTGRKLYCAKGCRKKLLMSLNWLRPRRDSVYVATSVETAIALNSKFGCMNKTSAIYFIQGHEAWNVPESTLNNTYSYGFRNIAISHWLESKIHACGGRCTVIPNGFDFEYFKMCIPPEKKNPYRVAMLWHHDERKGCAYGLEAILFLKNKYPSLQATFFGVPERPDTLPTWIEYHRMPDRDTHNHIYNSAALFIAPSHQEGWGLTVGEAMICGCAIVCTDIGGFREMCEDGVNALMSPVKDANAMARNIEMLINNDALRLRIASNGLNSIRKFNWEDSYSKFREIVDACELKK